MSDSERINQACGDLREGKTGIKRAATNMGKPGNFLFLFLTNPLQLNESSPMADSENPYLLNIVSNVVTGEINNWEHTYERVDNITRQQHLVQIGQNEAKHLEENIHSDRREIANNYYCPTNNRHQSYETNIPSDCPTRDQDLTDVGRDNSRHFTNDKIHETDDDDCSSTSTTSLDRQAKENCCSTDNIVLVDSETYNNENNARLIAVSNGNKEWKAEELHRAYN